MVIPIYRWEPHHFSYANLYGKVGIAISHLMALNSHHDEREHPLSCHIRSKVLKIKGHFLLLWIPLDVPGIYLGSQVCIFSNLPMSAYFLFPCRIFYIFQSEDFYYL